MVSTTQLATTKVTKRRILAYKNVALRGEGDVDIEMRRTIGRPQARIYPVKALSGNTSTIDSTI